MNESEYTVPDPLVLTDEEARVALKTVGEVTIPKLEAEIKRLTKLQESTDNDFSQARKLIDERNVEIERLMDKMTLQGHFIDARNQLIRELANALEFYEDPEIGVSKELLKRARNCLDLGTTESYDSEK